MTLAQMRFAGFTWFHNPKEIRIIDEKSVGQHLSPDCRCSSRSFGRKCRVIYGTGELYGEDCLKQYRKLYELYCQNKPGILSIPQLPPLYAVFEELVFEEGTVPDVVTYKFKFRECEAKSFDTQKQYHTVKSGETLWDIAYIYGMTVDELVALNPSIKRPDYMKTVERVRLC